MDTYIKRADTKQGEFALFICALIFGTFGVLAKQLGNSTPPLLLAFLINLVQLTYFAAVAYKNGGGIRVTPETRKSVALFALLNMLPLFFFINAMQWLGIGAVLLIQNTVTLFTSLVQDYAKTRQISPIQLSLMVIALGALAIIYLPFDLDNVIGMVFAAGVGFSNALTNQYRQKLGNQYTASQLSLYSSGAGSLVFGVVSALFASSFPSNIGLVSVVYFLLYALLHIATTLLLNIGFAKVPLTLGNTILLLEIVVGYGLGALVFGESYGLYQAVGSTILFSAIFGMRVAPSNGNAK